MSESFALLVGEGLYAENLARIVKLSRDRFDDNPLLYWTIITVCEKLESEYNSQAVPEEHYQQIITALQKPLLELVSEVECPPRLLVERLNRFLGAFSRV